jgi:hypothetical protein
MRVVRWRTAAWVALAFGVAISPALANPPAGASGQAGKGKSVAASEKSGSGSTGKVTPTAEKLGVGEPVLQSPPGRAVGVTHPAETLGVGVAGRTTTATTGKLGVAQPTGNLVNPAGSAVTNHTTAGNTGLGTTTGTLGHLTGSTGTGSVEGVNPQRHAESVLSLLRDARHEIGRAHYPYEGHRALAMKEIDRAIRELTPPRDPNSNPVQQMQTHATTGHAATAGHATSGGHAAGGAGAGGGTVAQPPSQAEADARMWDAIKLLTRARARVQEHNADAADDIAAAIGQVKEALKIQ